VITGLYRGCEQTAAWVWGGVPCAAGGNVISTPWRNGGIAQSRGYQQNTAATEPGSFGTTGGIHILESIGCHIYSNEMKAN